MKSELDNFTLWIIFGLLSVMSVLVVIIIVNLVISVTNSIQIVG